MRKEFLPYYLSRAILSCVFSVLVCGFTWKALVLAIVLFGGFILYLHSGWFRVDPSHPLTPLRRDARAQQVQRKALIASVCVGLLIYILSLQVAVPLGWSLPTGNLALSLGVITYFLTQFILLART
jgi:hypothetical protein